MGLDVMCLSTDWPGVWRLPDAPSFYRGENGAQKKKDLPNIAYRSSAAPAPEPKLPGVRKKAGPGQQVCGERGGREKRSQSGPNGIKVLGRGEVTGESQLEVKGRLGLGSLGRAQPLPSPNVANLRPVQQLPAVGSLVTPAHIPWVSPQQPHLIRGVTCMPQGIPEVLAWARH